MAWACAISKATDPATGLEITPPEHDYTSLLISRPKFFPFSLRARSEERKGEVWANWRKAVERGDVSVEGSAVTVDGFETGSVEKKGMDGFGVEEKVSFAANGNGMAAHVPPRVVVAAA